MLTFLAAIGMFVLFIVIVVLTIVALIVGSIPNEGVNLINYLLSGFLADVFSVLWWIVVAVIALLIQYVIIGVGKAIVLTDGWAALIEVAIFSLPLPLFILFDGAGETWTQIAAILLFALPVAIKWATTIGDKMREQRGEEVKSHLI